MLSRQIFIFITLHYIISEYRWNKTIYLFHNDFGRDMYNNCLKD